MVQEVHRRARHAWFVSVETIGEQKKILCKVCFMFCSDLMSLFVFSLVGFLLRACSVFMSRSFFWFAKERQYTRACRFAKLRKAPGLGGGTPNKAQL